MKSISTIDDNREAITTPGESFSKEIPTGNISKEFQDILSELQQASSTVAKLTVQHGYRSTGPFTTHQTQSGHLYYTSNQLSETTRESVEKAIETINPKHKQCWHNAKMIASMVDAAEYTEGYAFNLLPVQHGWITINTNSPTIIEVTNPFYEYVGCRMPNLEENIADSLFGEWIGENRSIIKKHLLESDTDTEPTFAEEIIPTNDGN